MGLAISLANSLKNSRILFAHSPNNHLLIDLPELCFTQSSERSPRGTMQRPRVAKRPTLPLMPHLPLMPFLPPPSTNSKRKHVKYFTIKQVAENHLNVSTRTVYRLINTGELRRVYIRGAARVTESSLKRFTSTFDREAN